MIKYLKFKEFYSSIEECVFHLLPQFVQDENQRALSLSACRLPRNGSLCGTHRWRNLNILFHPTLFDISPGVRLHCEFCINWPGDENAGSLGSERIVTIPAISHSYLFLLRIQSYNCFSVSSEYNKAVWICISSYLSISQNFVEEIVIELKHFQLSVLQDEESYIDYIIMFDHIIFRKLYLVKFICQKLRKFLSKLAVCVCSAFIHLVKEWRLRSIFW